VYLRGHADTKEQKLLERADVGVSPAAVAAVGAALRVAGIRLDEVAAFDLYSCFPFPVFNICDGTGLATDDERGLTLTGGLPFFGGPGNNYSMHAIAEAVHEMRGKPGQFALVGANGGIASKYSVGIYSTEAADWMADNSAALCDAVSALPKVSITEKADGAATVETYTVRYDWQTPTGIVMGRMDSDGSRFLATTKDEALLALLCDGDSLGASIVVRCGDKGNRAALA
jgi:acetyl-CoA C-acetyltransferase